MTGALGFGALRQTPSSPEEQRKEGKVLVRVASDQHLLPSKPALEYQPHKGS